MTLITAIIKDSESDKIAESNILVDSNNFKQVKKRFESWLEQHNLSCLHYTSGILSDQEIELIQEKELNLIKL